jgi:hypothetical protein
VPDVHLPHLEDDEDEPAAGPALQAAPGTPADQPLVRAARRSKSLLKIGLEVILISSGVFLGLMGEQWRERAQHREIAEVSLRRFRMELQTNRNAVASVRNKHVAKLKYLESYFQLYEAKDAEGRKKLAWPDTANTRPGTSRWPHSRWLTSTPIWLSPSLTSMPSSNSLMVRRAPSRRRCTQRRIRSCFCGTV